MSSHLDLLTLVVPCSVFAMEDMHDATVSRAGVRDPRRHELIALGPLVHQQARDGADRHHDDRHHCPPVNLSPQAIEQTQNAQRGAKDRHRDGQGIRRTLVQTEFIDHDEEYSFHEKHKFCLTGRSVASAAVPDVLTRHTLLSEGRLTGPAPWRGQLA